jgi:hypothetical protein
VVRSDQLITESAIEYEVKMAKTELYKKLRLSPGQTALVLNPPREYIDILETVPDNLNFSEHPEDKVDFVHLFIKNQSELNQYIDTALEAIKYDGLFWISYPKGSSKVQTDVNRDILWELLLEKGIRPVMQVSVDSTWSAIRFRPAEAVGK